MAIAGDLVNERLVAFALLSFAIIVVPGPSVLFVVGRALSLGRRVALATVVGNAAGELVQAAGVAVGLGAVLAGSDLLFTIAKLVGAAYLAYLGVQTIRTRGDGDGLAPAPDPALASLGVRRGPLGDDARAARAGFIVGLTNPKTSVFFAALLPQFVTAQAALPPALQMVALGGVFAAIALVSDSCWALGAGRARSWFLRSPDRLGRIRAASGVVMLGLAARLATTSRAV